MGFPWGFSGCFRAAFYGRGGGGATEAVCGLRIAGLWAGNGFAGRLKRVLAAPKLRFQTAFLPKIQAESDFSANFFAFIFNLIVGKLINSNN
ncbi:roadblock/LC7 domain protein [Neisseria bacilliformis ATCC BAA-1200]|uniref:Roadblock/LC7 domain protein n=1 Tax=Neisseria bacilliformis ATCC BAA-1200 TaxID=888742 RepID=F2B8T3_9NEIS|nr:roadblock/LC7 domain protein [Neisseria bacilliformis ATCC BAA-1200]